MFGPSFIILALGFFISSEASTATVSVNKSLTFGNGNWRPVFPGIGIHTHYWLLSVQIDPNVCSLLFETRWTAADRDGASTQRSLGSAMERMESTSAQKLSLTVLMGATRGRCLQGRGSTFTALVKIPNWGQAGIAGEFSGDSMDTCMQYTYISGRHISIVYIGCSNYLSSGTSVKAAVLSVVEVRVAPASVVNDSQNSLV